MYGHCVNGQIVQQFRNSRGPPVSDQELAAGLARLQMPALQCTAKHAARGLQQGIKTIWPVTRQALGARAKSDVAAEDFEDKSPLHPWSGSKLP